MLKRLIIPFILIPCLSFAQFTDDFEDADISNWTESTTGRWAASADSPLNGSYSLHHIFDNPDAGKDQISVQLAGVDLNADTTKWRFKIKYDYNPSDGNNWSVFLVSDADANQMLPGGTVNGYALGVNFTGSDDILKLLKIVDGSATEIIATTLNWDADTDPSDIVALEIIKSKFGNWEVFFNSSGDINNLISIGTGNDNTYPIADYFGVYYDYTSSADRNLWIDDVEVIGEIYVDNDPPVIDSLHIISPTELLIEFDEEVDSFLAVNEANYTIDGGIGNPASVELSETKDAVSLYLPSALINKKYYNLSIQNIEDTESNIIKDTTLQFLYFVPEQYDVVINEIMADPTPSVNLPEYEYIEIKNTTQFDIDLTGWKIVEADDTIYFPTSNLGSESYVILCSGSAAADFENYGEVVVLSFSSTQINNDGTSLLILDDKNNVIDSLNFTTEWYQDSEKEDGGWSIEKIDPLNNCSGITNWKASEDENGGTPGQENSVFASNIDNEAPQIAKVEILSENQLKITFDEPINEESLLEKTNYQINHSVGNPFSIVAGSDHREVDLLFLNSFPQETELSLRVENLEDYCGNVNSLITYNFIYYVPQPYDIVINEIMANPDPPIGLPEVEYIELYNITDYDIYLKDWTLTVGSTQKYFENDTINSGEYLILCDDDLEEQLTNYGKTSTFSSLSLTDGGQMLVLRDKDEHIISQVTYKEDWYQDDFKAEGGWSLEQVDPFNPCGEENNWIASESETGGTPGIQNSVMAENPDLDAPGLLRIAVIDDQIVKLFFNESIDSLSAMQTSIYSVDNGIGNPVTIRFDGVDYKSVMLDFADNFENNTIYTLEISGGITDCAGNEITGGSMAQFSLPEIPEENDIVINEILFNPLPDGVDFVEIYNRSNKTIDLAELLIASYDDEDLEFVSIERITEDGYLIFPGEYLVLTEDPEQTKQDYLTENPDGFIEVENLPGYNDDQGRVMLLDEQQNIIDNVGYNEDMHFALLATNEGVSLERIHYSRPSDDKTNWHSASELVGFATPAYENSQFKESEEIDEDVIIEPEIFSPDNDGFEDFANINFTFDEPGYVANIKIYDSRGRLIRYLANNQLLGIEGTITWDGLDENSQKAPVGIYVVFIEIFDLEGNVKQYKESVVVAARY